MSPSPVTNIEIKGKALKAAPDAPVYDQNKQETTVQSVVFFDTKQLVEEFKKDTTKSFLVICDTPAKIALLSYDIRGLLGGLNLGKLSVNLHNIRAGSVMSRPMFRFATPGLRLNGEQFDAVLLKVDKPEEFIQTPWYREVIQLNVR